MQNSSAKLSEKELKQIAATEQVIVSEEIYLAKIPTNQDIFKLTTKQQLCDSKFAPHYF